MSNAQKADLLRARLRQKNCKELIRKKCHATIEKLKGCSGTTTGMSSHDSVPAHENGEMGQGSSSITSVSVLSDKMGMGPEIQMQNTEQTSNVIYPLQEQVSTFNEKILPLQEHEVSPPDTLDNTFICTCCRVKDPNRRKYVYFSLANYDKNNDVVDRALKYRFSRSYMREVICKKCHNSLKKRVLPRLAVSSPVKPSSCNVMRCIICSLPLVNKMHIFRRSTYGENPKLDCALQERDVQDGSVICQKCHSQFTRSSMYSRFACNLLTQRRSTVECNPEEFARFSVNISIYLLNKGHTRVVVSAEHAMLEQNMECTIV